MITTRQGGFSSGHYHSNNLGAHVGDSAENVEANRHLLNGCLPAPPHWLEQVHGSRVYTLKSLATDQPPIADASYTNSSNRVCAVLTADCLPILLCNDVGDEVAAVHAGWRGMADGVISQSVTHFRCPPDRILAYLGPAISGSCFEVGVDVMDAFSRAASERHFAEPVIDAFKRTDNGRFMADLYHLARAELGGLGVKQIYGGDCCTYTDAQRFFSYRREGVTGRMASLIWIKDR